MIPYNRLRHILAIVVAASCCTANTECDMTCRSLPLLAPKWSREGIDIPIIARECTVRTDCPEIAVHSIVSESNMASLRSIDITFICINHSNIGFVDNSSSTSLVQSFTSLRLQDCQTSWDDIAHLARQVTLLEVDNLFTSQATTIRPAVSEDTMDQLADIHQLQFSMVNVSASVNLDLSTLLPGNGDMILTNIAILGLRCLKFKGFNTKASCEQNQLQFEPTALELIFPRLQSLSIEGINIGRYQTALGYPWDPCPFRIPYIMLQHSSFEHLVYSEQLSVTLGGEFPRRLNLMHIPDLDISAVCTNLEGIVNQIVLSNNLLSEIPGDCFENTLNLAYLDISGNSFGRLHHDLFRRLNDLEVLHLANSSLIRISPGTMDDLVNLKVLGLGFNDILRLSKDTLTNLSSLEKLYLHDNKIQEVEAGSLPSFSTSLNYIDLKRNMLLSIPIDCLSLPKLYKCDCDNNNIDLANLETLVGSFNPIRIGLTQPLEYYMTARSESFVGPAHQTSQTVISLRYNNVNRIGYDDSWNWEEKQQLAGLLSFFQFDMQSAMGGRRLDCSCELYKLKVFILKEANLLIDSLFLHTSALQPSTFLDWKCHISSLVTSVSTDQPFLEVNDTLFVCQNNTIPSCPKQCVCYSKPYDGTIIVDCSDAGLTQLPQFLPLPAGNGSLIVTVEWNQITHLPNCEEKRYQWLNHASFLNIKSNALTPSIPEFETFLRTCFKSLRQLYMAYNNIQYIPQAIKATGLRKFSFYDNKLTCDCTNYWMKKWILESGSLIFHPEKVQCTNKGRPVIELEKPDFICEGLTSYLAPILIYPALAILVLILTVTIYVYNFQLKILIFEKFNLHPFDKDKEPQQKRYDVYVLCCLADIVWVKDILLEGLENYGYRTCVKERDFSLGGGEAQELSNTFAGTHRVLVVYSQRFINDGKAVSDFYHAYQYSKTLSRKRFLVFVKLDGRINFKEHKIFQNYLSTNSFVHVRSTRFWARIRYWLPKPGKLIPSPVVPEDPEHYDSSDEEESDTSLMLSRRAPHYGAC